MSFDRKKTAIRQLKRNNFNETISLVFLFLLSCVLLTACAAGAHTDLGSVSENGSKEFQFIYFSDTQADPDVASYEEWGKLFRQAASDGNPGFALLGGDLVNDGEDAEEWEAFFTEAGDTIPLYPAAGNHDGGMLRKELFQLPGNGPQGFEETVYSFDYENTHFIVMDSNAMGNPDYASLLCGWLEDDLKEAKNADWKIVMFHHPMYPILDIPKDQTRAETMRQYYLPALERAGVDLILCGHQHSYARTYPMKDGKISTRQERGVIQLMCVSGPKAYGIGDYDYIEAYQENLSVYLKFTIEGEALSFVTKDAEGNTIDEGRWTKGAH